MSLARRAAPLALLAVALAVGVWRAEAQLSLSRLQRAPLITPRWAFALPNTTSNFTASQPVTWELLVRDNTKRVVGSLPGYAYVEINDEFVEILAGKRGGVFHVRAVAHHCATTTSVGCVGTSLWVVLSYAQFTGMGLGAAAAVGLCSFALLRRLQPPPETPLERNEESIRLSVIQEHYGTVSPQPPGRASPQVGRTGLGPGMGAYGANSAAYGLPPGGYSPPNYGGRAGRLPPHTRDPSQRLGPPRRLGGAGDTL